MKRTLLVACSIIASVGALAQGTVNFNTKVAADAIDAPVNIGGVKVDGAAGWAQLYAGAAGSAESALKPVGAAINFRAGAAAGYLSGGEVTIPGIPAGGAAVVQLRAWEAAGGATFEAAQTAGKKIGVSNLLALAGTGNPTSAPPGTPVNLVGLQGFALTATVIPEPSTIALAALGAAVLFIRRRK